jgi:adenylate kinase family enzyme
LADNSDLGRKILVCGQGGKSTLARAIAADTGLPYIELDAIKHMANWVERERDDFRAEIQRVWDDNPDGWVIDGNYGTDLEGMVHKVAETVVFVNMPWRVLMWRTFWRSLDRIWNRRDLWNGNQETWRDVFFSRDGFMLYLITHRKHFQGRRKDRVLVWSSGARLIELEGRRALNRFYKDRGLVRG